MADSSVANTPQVAAAPKLGTAKLLFESAERMGLQPCWITPGQLFAVQINDHEQYINFARSPLNSHTSASLARNKYLTRRILERHGLRNIPFTRPNSYTEATAFLTQYHKIIAKPVTGSGSRDIHVITRTEQLQPLKVRDYIFEQYIAGTELRYLVLNNRVIAVHESEYGTSVAYDRQLQRISYPRNAWDPTLITTSLQATEALGLQFAAVDYMVDDAGQAHVLEINTAPGLKWFHAPSYGPIVDVAQQFLAAIIAVPARKEAL